MTDIIHWTEEELLRQAVSMAAELEQENDALRDDISSLEAQLEEDADKLTDLEGRYDDLLAAMQKVVDQG